jgi:hypothetical protein
MHFRKSSVALIIALAGVVLCVGNLWIAARRSTIPVSLDAVLVEKEIGREKHPGTDDVHWLILDNGVTMHVDEHVFNAVREGERLRKEAWSKQLLHGQNVHHLTWSADVRGMIWVMPVGIGLVGMMTVMIFRNPTR